MTDKTKPDDALILSFDVTTVFSMEMPIANPEGLEKEAVRKLAEDHVRGLLQGLGAYVQSMQRRSEDKPTEQLVITLTGTRLQHARQLWFSFDEPETPEDYYIGWSYDRRWNGWGSPLFEKAEADRMMLRFNAELQRKDATYDPVTETYFFPSFNDTEYPEEPPHPGYPKETLALPDGSTREVYAIGSGEWCWNVDYKDPTKGPVTP